MNDLKLQEGLQPIDKHLRPIKVGDEISALEISTEDVRVSRDMFLGGSITTKAINSDSDITLNAVNDVNIPVNVGLTFGDYVEKIEGNGLDLTISSSRHLTLDIAGVLVSDSAIGTFQFLDDGDSDDLFQITVAGGTGATTLETTSADTDGIMHIKAEGDTIELEAESYIKCANPIQMNEVASAVGDNAGYGQVWVKNSTPNELCFTDDAGTDLVGIGKYFYETKVCNFYTNSVNNQFIPLAGYVIERDSITGQNEYVTMVAPYNGEVVRIMFRSEIAQNGTLEFDIFESSDGTEKPGTVTGVVDTSINIADDTSVTVDFSSMTSGTNALVKGRIYAIQIDTPSAPYDTNVTVVFKWDTTT